MLWYKAIETLIKKGKTEEASALVRIHHEESLRENAGGRRVRIKLTSLPDTIVEGILLPSQLHAFDGTDGESVEMAYLPTDPEVYLREYFPKEAGERWGFSMIYCEAGLYAACAEVEFEKAEFADNESLRAFLEEAKKILKGSSLFSEEFKEDELCLVGNLALLWQVVDQRLKMLE